jgi:hypothetical protein
VRKAKSFNVLYVPEGTSMHLTVCFWFLISSGWGGGKVGNQRGRREGDELVGENKRGGGVDHTGGFDGGGGAVR